VIIQFVLLKMGMLMLETCRDYNVTYIFLMNKELGIKVGKCNKSNRRKNSGKNVEEISRYVRRERVNK
jgi:ribosomal protein L7Ae-like RNA K-turn-binding protein